MNLPAIPEIRVETAGDEVTYWLPARPLGKLRWIGLIPLGFSVLWFTGAGHMFLDAARPFSNAKPHGIDYFFAAFQLVFLAAGCMPVGFGLLVIFGRCRIRWRDGRLTVSDYAGLFGWRRRLPKAPIRKFSVRSGTLRNGQPMAAGPLADMAILMAEFEGGRPRIVTMGYPQQWVQAIATDLSARAGRSQPAPPEIETFDARGNSSLLRDAAEKPADSKVVLQRTGGGIVLEVPPAGLRQGSMGLFLFASAWCAFMTLFTLGVLFGKPSQPSNGAAPFWPFLAGFWAVGLGMMAGAIHLGKRRATLTAGSGGLTVVQSGPFGVKRREFRREEIAAIQTGASHIKVKHRLALELQIHPVTGGSFDLLVGRDAGELRWMAAELRNALGLKVKEESVAAQSFLESRLAAAPPPGSKIVGAFVAILFFIAIGVGMFWNFGRVLGNHAQTTGAVHPQPQAEATPAATPGTFADPSSPDGVMKGLIVFSSFDRANAYGTNTWYVGSDAHADWFVSPASGRLAVVELAIEPAGNLAKAGNITVSLAKDKRGLPGAVLETFPASAMTSPAVDPVQPLVFKSLKQPALEAGKKYWLCVKSSGGWLWHFNNQNIVHNSARELRPRKWASAGEYCYVCAFGVMVTTNQSSPPAN